jgi:ubiquinone/menaquinone biosynthesis C-methylase UbiE
MGAPTGHTTSEGYSCVTTIRFDDGAAYERYMGKWSQLAGDAFLRWLHPAPALRWLDVGCGNGAFTEMIVERCAPASVQGIDPSPEQLAYARTRGPLQGAQFRQGDAMALPYPDSTFDVAVMPLVIFFLSTPAKGVTEMRRVVSPNGIVTAYGWDMAGGGFPYATLFQEMRSVGLEVPSPPSPEASRRENLQQLWTAAGLEAVETTEIVVERTFADFDDYWATVLGSASAGAQLRALGAMDVTRLQGRLRQALAASATGPITYSARANAVKGRVPGSRL